jgi:hypothetical protein
MCGIRTVVAGPSGHVVYGRSPREILGSNPGGGHGSFSVVIVECCPVEVCATSWSLVQRSRADWGASSEYNIETASMKRPQHHRENISMYGPLFCSDIMSPDVQRWESKFPQSPRTFTTYVRFDPLVASRTTLKAACITKFMLCLHYLFFCQIMLLIYCWIIQLPSFNCRYCATPVDFNGRDDRDKEPPPLSPQNQKSATRSVLSQFIHLKISDTYIKTKNSVFKDVTPCILVGTWETWEVVKLPYLNVVLFYFKVENHVISEELVPLYQSLQCHILEESNVHIHRCQKLKE